MDYVSAVQEKLNQELAKAGYSASSEHGAYKIYASVFISELDKLNKRLEELEQA